VAHAVSLSYARFDHVPVVAVAVAMLLHGAVAAALYWVSPLRPIDPYEDALTVTMEQEKPVAIPPSEIPATPPVTDPPPQDVRPEPAPAPMAAPTPPIRWGLAPVGPKSDKEAEPGVEEPRPHRDETPADEATQPEPPKPDPPKEQQLALATPPPPPPPPSLEQALPPVEAPPPPVSSREVPAPPPPAIKAPPPPPPKQPQPAQRAQPAPRPTQQQALQSSPLNQLSQQRTSPSEQQASRQAPMFQNPADLHGIRRAETEYLWYIARKVSQHQEFVGNATTQQGTVELRLTIARNGQLLGISVSRSSGLTSLDNSSMHIVRQAAPFGPFPPEITTAQHTFTLPLYFRRNQ
jgi:TonB family protein